MSKMKNVGALAEMHENQSWYNLFRISFVFVL